VVKKKGILALTQWAIMENVNFLSSFEIVTCDVYSDVAALFLGSGERQGQGGASISVSCLLDLGLGFSVLRNGGSVCLRTDAFTLVPILLATASSSKHLLLPALCEGELANDRPITKVPAGQPWLCAPL
jgi:hypothetical protein